MSQQNVNLDENGSYGYVGLFANVVCASTYISGTLIIRFDSYMLASVARETLRLFRWDERLHYFQLVFRSGVGSDSDYVWGRITSPGKYAVIGLHSHPLVIRTAKVSQILTDLMSSLNPDIRVQLQKRICELILHSPELHRAIEEPRQLKNLIRESLLRGFPNPLIAWKPNGGFEPPSFPNHICPKIDNIPQLPEVLRLLPEWQLLANEDLGCLDSGWQSIGPGNISGCIIQVAVDPIDNNRIYCAASDGGLWRLDDVSMYPTVTWVPLTDQNDSLIIRAFAVAPTDNQVIYIADGLGHLLRSANGGRTWVITSTTDLGYVRRIIVNPLDENEVFVASGDYRPNLASGEGGLWRSLTGGSTWRNNPGQRTLFDGDVTDAVLDPGNPSIIYIGVRRLGLYKSVSSGDDKSWNIVIPWSMANSPVGTMIKVAIGHHGNETDRTIAVKFDQEVFVNHKAGIPPDSGGESWVSKGKWGGDGQGDWDHVIAIDPFNNDVIITGAQDLYRTSNGGEGSWDLIAGYEDPVIVHPDQQSVMFDPTTRGVIYLSNDGGVYRTSNWGSTWQELNRNLITGQFSDIGVANAAAIGGMYHQGLVASFPMKRDRWAYIEGYGWELKKVYADPIRANTFYVFTDKLWRRFLLFRPDHPTMNIIGDFTPISIAIDPRISSNILLVGCGNPGLVMRTLEGDKDTPTWNVEPGINIGPEAIVSIAFAPSNAGMAYAVSSSGRVFCKIDVNSNENWEQMGQWPESGILHTAVNCLHEKRIYLITSNKVARSEDGGKTWIEIPGTDKDVLPNSQFNSIVAHYHDGETIFLAADIGVFITTDEGHHWLAYDENLPNASIRQVLWSGDYLYASTFGRGIWRRYPCL